MQKLHAVDHLESALHSQQPLRRNLFTNRRTNPLKVMISLPPVTPRIICCFTFIKTITASTVYVCDSVLTNFCPTGKQLSVRYVSIILSRNMSQWTDIKSQNTKNSGSVLAFKEPSVEDAFDASEERVFMKFKLKERHKRTIIFYDNFNDRLSRFFIFLP